MLFVGGMPSSDSPRSALRRRLLQDNSDMIDQDAVRRLLVLTQLGSGPGRSHQMSVAPKPLEFGETFCQQIKPCIVAHNVQFLVGGPILNREQHSVT